MSEIKNESGSANENVQSNVSVQVDAAVQTNASMQTDANARAEKLLDAIGMVDDELIAEAHADDEMSAGVEAPAGDNEGLRIEAFAGGKANTDASNQPESTTARPQAKRTGWSKRAIAAAACLILVIGVGAFALFNVQSSNRTAEEPAAKESAAKETVTTESVEEKHTLMMDRRDSSSPMAYEGEALSAADAGGSTPSGSLGAGTIGDSHLNEGEAFVLTAASWNDNENWPFFTNLVNAGAVSFPSFGIDPRHRVKVTVTDEAGTVLRGEEVVLRDKSGAELWHATSAKNGVAYLFYREGEAPEAVAVGGVEKSLSAGGSSGQQGTPIASVSDDVTVVVGASAPAIRGMQVMFIVDTTGSMSDEIAYLQKDFAAIASDVGSDGVTYSVNFYRDEGKDEEYVTKCNSFTGDVAEVQRLLNAEYADGGGDLPEAVAQILTETITNNGEWRDDAAKIAFLVFDAPPHEGTDAEIDAAVRSAAARGIQLVPVVASNADRETELFGRALSICTDGTYVFVTDDSGVGDSHLEPIVGDYTVELLHDVIVHLIQEAR